MHLAELYCRLYFPCHLVSGRWAGGAIWQMYPVNWTTLVAPALAWLYVTLAVCFGLAQLYVAVTSACTHWQCVFWLGSAICRRDIGMYVY